jgi:hypothetical protein
MKLVYTHENRFFVFNAKNIVENAGIDVVLKNEYAAGGIGDLAPIEAWPELWVLSEADYDTAVNIIEKAFKKDARADWVCPNCGEKNDAAFELCWQCQCEC